MPAFSLAAWRLLISYKYDDRTDIPFAVYPLQVDGYYNIK
jgi:hypothetical protein